MGTSQSHNLKSSPNWSAAKRAMTSLANGTDNKPASNAKFLCKFGNICFDVIYIIFGMLVCFSELQIFLMYFIKVDII